MASPKAIAIGIDLGTTNFSTVIYLEDGSTTTLHEQEIDTKPSHVFITSEFSYDVGVPIDVARFYPELGIYGIFYTLNHDWHCHYFLFQISNGSLVANLTIQ